MFLLPLKYKVLLTCKTNTAVLINVGGVKIIFPFFQRNRQIVNTRRSWIPGDTPLQGINKHKYAYFNYYNLNSVLCQPLFLASKLSLIHFHIKTGRRDIRVSLGSN